MNVCRWKGTKKNGRILCGKPLNEVESITTDDSVITCKECLLLSGKRTGVKQTHLNADFLSFANIGENGLLDFQDYKKKKMEGQKRVTKIRLSCVVVRVLIILFPNIE